MALNKQISRLSKIIAEREGITFPQAEARLSALTLEIVVGPEASSYAAHTAVLTAVNLGHRSFLGGVRVTGCTDQPLRCALPLAADTLGEAAALVGASDFAGVAGWKLGIGSADSGGTRLISLWWDGWRAGASERQISSDAGENPLTGIAAAALGVGAVFARAAGLDSEEELQINLWAESDGTPAFSEVLLPGALWLVGVGNLGQAYLWALTALPYTDPAAVDLLLQDADQVSEENWGTSVLVFGETFGELKTRVGERWALAKGFKVKRVDRYLAATDRLANDDARVALSGLDRIAPRKALGEVGFAVIVDAGLGRTVRDFDRLRVTVFDDQYPIDAHFANQVDEAPSQANHAEQAYRDLEARIGACGMAEIAGASAAVPFVSAVASAIAVTRLIALSSGRPLPTSEVGFISRLSEVRASPARHYSARGPKHAGPPKPQDM